MRAAESALTRTTPTRPGSRASVDHPRRPCRAASALFLLFLAGCTSWRDYVANGFKVGPNYCRPPAPVAERWIEADDPSVSSDPAQDAAWWRTFHDPVLDSLVQAAYRQNLTLRVAGMRILEARAQRGIAAGELFPQSQEAFGSYTRYGLSENVVNPPPVPQVSVRPSLTRGLMGTQARRMARAIAATSAVVGPFMSNPIRKPAIWVLGNLSSFIPNTTSSISA